MRAAQLQTPLPHLVMARAMLRSASASPCASAKPALLAPGRLLTRSRGLKGLHDRAVEPAAATMEARPPAIAQQSLQTSGVGAAANGDRAQEQQPMPPPPGYTGLSGGSDSGRGPLDSGGGIEPAQLAVLRRAAGATALQVADGPMGRGLFTTTPIRAGEPLFSVPDVLMLIVSDPENEPHRETSQPQPPGAPGGTAADGERQLAFAASSLPSEQGREEGQDQDPDGSQNPGHHDPDLFYSAGGHQDYLRRWQAAHGLRLPPGLRDVLGASGSLPAPARLALWLMWLRRCCGGGEEGAGGEGARVGGEYGGGPEGPTGGLRFWRSYCASLPQPRDVTCPSVFSEDEANLLQVPSYQQQWRRTRDSLTWLLGVANRVAREDGDGDGDHLHGAGGAGPDPGPEPSLSDGPSPLTAPSSPASPAYSLDELCYCYALATSRCFHMPGRMALVPYADMANHQPLWQASAFPFWLANDDGGLGQGGQANNDNENGSPVPSASGIAAAPAAVPAAPVVSAAAAPGPLSGWFQFRAVRDLAPGSEVCICYSEGGNTEQLFSYGFVRQANPYDRVDLNPHPSVQEVEEAEVEAQGAVGDNSGDALRPAAGAPEGLRLCWPAVVAAAGFWAPADTRPPMGAAAAVGSLQRQPVGRSPPALLPPRISLLGWASSLMGAALQPEAEAGREMGEVGDESPAALEQSLLRPRERLADGWVWGPVEGPQAQRLRLQRRRAALLSLPHTVADAVALRRSGLGRSAAPEEELRRWAREEEEEEEAAATPDAQRRLLAGQLEAVDALLDLVGRLEAAMATSLQHGEFRRSSGRCNACRWTQDDKPMDGAHAWYAGNLGVMRGRLGKI